MLPLWDKRIPGSGGGRAWRDFSADLTPESTFHHLDILASTPKTAPRIHREIVRQGSASTCEAIGPRRIQQESILTSRTRQPWSSAAMGFITGFVGATGPLQ